MIRKIELSLSCCLAVMTILMTGCVGYSGKVDTGGSGNGSSSTSASTGMVSANPASLNFGTVATGNSTSQSVSVTNAGSSTVVLSQLSSSNASFSASGPSLPVSLSAGQSVSVKIAFAPTASGSASGTVTLGSNASNAPTTIAVSGTGGTSSSGSSGAPSITAQPTSQTVTAGQTASFSVTATGTAPLSYQWQKSGTAINGATSASYTTPATTSSDNGAQFAVVVSDSAGSVTSSAATLTVSAGTLMLNPSPTSLSFGSVNVGSSSALPVTLTNAGTSNVTVSSVTVTGAGFNATGVSTGQILTPGQTASLNVTFTPATSGSLSGSVTVASNAANSPTTVALSGSGTTQSSSATPGAPTCGKSGDTTNHVPTDWTTFVPPAKGQSYVDPTFGCTVTRITDASNEDWSGSFYLPLNMGYATASPFNASDTYLMLTDGWNQHFITDLQGNIIVPIANMPAENDGWELWDAVNSNVFYYTNGNSLMKGTISGNSVTASVMHQFSEYAAINFMDDTDVSQDGTHVAIVGGDTTGSSPENVFVYNFSTNTKGPVYTTTCTGSVNAPNNACLHKVILTSDNNAMIDFANDGQGTEQGDRLWTGSLISDLLSGLTDLLPLQDTTDHSDGGADMNGNPVFIELGNSTTVPGFTNPCPSGWGLDVRQVYNPSSAVCLLDNDVNNIVASWHVGYRGNAQQPWVGLSFFDAGRTPSPEWFDSSPNYVAPTASTWYTYEDEIVVVRVDANNSSALSYRLARAYSRSNTDYEAQPHAAISRDGNYIAFNSNMAYAHSGCPANFQTSTNCTDVYVIKIK